MGGIQSTSPAQLISTPFPSILTLVFALSPTIPIPPPLPPIFLSHHGQSPLPPPHPLCWCSLSPSPTNCGYWNLELKKNKKKCWRNLACQAASLEGNGQRAFRVGSDKGRFKRLDGITIHFPVKQVSLKGAEHWELGAQRDRQHQWREGLGPFFRQGGESWNEEVGVGEECVYLDTVKYLVLHTF